MAQPVAKKVRFKEEDFNWDEEEQKAVRRMARNQERKAKQIRKRQLKEAARYFMMPALLDESKHKEVLTILANSISDLGLFKAVLNMAEIDVEAFTASDAQLRKDRSVFPRLNEGHKKQFRRALKEVVSDPLRRQLDLNLAVKSVLDESKHKAVMKLLTATLLGKFAFQEVFETAEIDVEQFKSRDDQLKQFRNVFPGLCDDCKERFDDVFLAFGVFYSKKLQRLNKSTGR